MSSVHVWPGEEEFAPFPDDDTPSPAPTDTAGDEAVLVPFDDDEDCDLPERYPTLLGVSCDGEDPDGDCDAALEGDFIVHRDDTRATRLGYVLDHATSNGWQVKGRHMPEMALTYCPHHRDPATNAPA